MADIILSCGHGIQSMERSYNVFHKAIDRMGEKAVSYSIVCKNCMDRYRTEGELFESDEEAFSWLDQEGW